MQTLPQGGQWPTAAHYFWSVTICFSAAGFWPLRHDTPRRIKPEVTANRRQCRGGQSDCEIWERQAGQPAHRLSMHGVALVIFFQPRLQLAQYGAKQQVD